MSRPAVLALDGGLQLVLNHVHLSQSVRSNHLGSRAELPTPKPRRKQPGLWCWDLRGSFFPGFAALEQDRHWLDCVTRTEGALVEKAGLHPLALGPNRKLYGLIATRAVIAGDPVGPDHGVNLLPHLRQ